MKTTEDKTALTSSPGKDGGPEVEAVKPSIDTMREAAWELIKKNGWGATARLSLHQVSGLMAQFGMNVSRGEVGCGYPDCGCCADAACEDAIKQHADFRPQPASTALVERLAERFDRIATIIDRNLYHQHEKIEDAKSIAVQMREELRALPAIQPVATMTKALEKCQKALAAMIDPSCIAQTTVINAFAMATEAEASARSALSASTSREGER